MVHIIVAEKALPSTADEVGERIAESIRLYFEDPANQALLRKLDDAGISLHMEEDRAEGSNKLKGLTFVISGSFQQHSRDELKELIEQNGGRNATSVSSKTDYLLGGDGIGPGKLIKVKELDIPVISEDVFLGMIE